jgi:integrase
MLSQVKTFLAWCIERSWLRENPAAGIKGIGRRRPRGKSLGKSGAELRVKDARAWYQIAVFKATRGDEGAVAALVALLLGMRASEIVTRKVSDLDTDGAPGDLLWIPCSKTPAGRRTLEVPEVLRPMLLARCENKAQDRYIFEAELRDDGVSVPHWRDWILHNVHRICGAAEVPKVTAHALRGLLATLTAERGLAGHLIAATLGHEDERTTMHAYAAPGAADAGIRRRGLVVLKGGAT